MAYGRLRKSKGKNVQGTGQQGPEAAKEVQAKNSLGPHREAALITTSERVHSPAPNAPAPHKYTFKKQKNDHDADDY